MWTKPQFTTTSLIEESSRSLTLAVWQERTIVVDVDPHE